MSILTSDQVTALRTTHYEGAAYFIAGPQAVVFAARVNGTPATSDFAQVTFDTVTTGAYADIVVGMDVRISHTNDITAAFFVGRARLNPTSTILYINETSDAIADNDYIFVIENRSLVIRQRYKTFVDYSVPYTPLPPIESNVDSAYVVCTTAATATFSLSSIGQALEKSATMSSVLWTISGATYTVGSASTANITFHVSTPYNKWASLKLTDSNGTTNTLWFTITAGNPDVDTFFRLCHEDVPISADWDNGYSTSLTFWANVSDLLDRTRITIVSVETFNLTSLGVGNVQCVGYLKTSTSNTQGDEKYGQKKDVQFEINGLMQLAGSLRFNQIAIRHNSSPTIWDEINIPTYQRNICHILAHHSTLLNLISMNFGTIDDTFSSGNTDVSETSLIDACRAAAKEVNAYLINDRAGKISLIRDPRIGSSAYRATIPDLTPSPIGTGDGFSFKLIHNPYDIVGWLDIGCAVIQPTTLARTYITANAPASGPGDGQEDDQNPSQLLAATANLTNALIEARQRTGDLFAMLNTHHTLEWVLTSGWGGVISPTCGVYYQFQIAASDDTRGIGVSSSTDWLCVSTSMTINRNGTQEITARFTEVTQGGAVLINVAISPSVATTPIPVLPVLSAYPAFPPAPSINYDSINPTNKIPRDPFSGMQNLPLTTEEAAAAANAQAAPGCSVTQISFRNPSAVNTGFISVLGTPYTIHLSGIAVIGETDSQNFDVIDAFPVLGFAWYGGGTRVPVFVGNDGIGFDLWDIPFERTQDDNYQSAVLISPNCKVNSVTIIGGTTGINFYDPTPAWTDSDSTGHLYAVKFITGAGHEDVIRVKIGPHL